MFHFHRSNSHSALLNQLQNKLSDKKSIDSFSFNEDLIIVQNKGMQRWLTLQLTEQFGITHALEFRFPLKFLWELYQSLCGFQGKDVLASKKEFMQWAIFDELNNGSKSFNEIEAYLKTATVTDVELKKWEISGVLASLFDEYELYRTSELPSKILTESKQGNWQFDLFKTIVESQPKGSFRHQLHNSLIENLRKEHAEIGYKRIFIYGIPTLPEASLRALILLAKHCEVHFFQIVPTDNSNWKNSKLEFKNHPLLQQLSKEGRELSHLIHEICESEEFEVERHDLFKKPDQDTTQLERLKKSFYDVEIGTKSELKEDESIIFSSNYSAAREIETLRDYLLNAFEDKKLQPSDVLIMSADIDKYAPFIKYYFSETIQGKSLPFSLADMKSSTQDEQIQALFALIDLLDSPLKRTDFIEFLSHESIRSHFGFDGLAINRITSWIEKSHVRFGWEKETEEYAWADVSFQSLREQWFNSIFYLPDSDHLQNGKLVSFSISNGDELETWAKVEQLFEALFELISELKADKNDSSNSKCKTIKEWLTWLLELYEKILSTEKDSTIPKKILKLQEIANYGNPTSTLSFKLFSRFIKQQFDTTSAGSGFLKGKITCSAMVPLRSLPFKIIALIGMNDGQFPGKKPRVSFDWLANEPKEGDRDRKTDDYYLLLESIISAKEKLYISYLGRNSRDDSKVPMSPPVSALLETIEQCCSHKPRIYEHPLYSHNQNYFTSDTVLFKSQNETALTVAESIFTLNKENEDRYITIANQFEQKAVFPSKLKDSKTRTIEIESLFKLWENSGDWILKNQKGIYVPKVKEELSNEESFRLNPLENYVLKEFLFEKILSKEEMTFEELFEIARQKGLIEASLEARSNFEAVFTEIKTTSDQIIEKHFDGIKPEKKTLTVVENDLEISIQAYQTNGNASLLVRFSDFTNEKYKHRIPILASLFQKEFGNEHQLILWDKNKNEDIVPKKNDEFTRVFIDQSKKMLENGFPTQYNWRKEAQTIRFELNEEGSFKFYDELEKEHFIDALISSALAAKDFNEEDALSLELNWKKGEWMLSKEALIAAKSFYVSQIKEAK